jgi:predicted nucleic acid-binding protein
VSAYADTGFLVSLYVLDANSAVAAARMEKVRLPIFLTPLAEVELTNAISLRLFRRELRPSKFKAALALVRRDLTDGILLLKPLTASAFDRAKRLSLRRTPHMGTRTLDILHVASALELRADTFYTFDQNQEKLARAEGLAVS